MEKWISLTLLWMIERLWLFLGFAFFLHQVKTWRSEDLDWRRRSVPDLDSISIVTSSMNSFIGGSTIPPSNTFWEELLVYVYQLSRLSQTLKTPVVLWVKHWTESQSIVWFASRWWSAMRLLTPPFIIVHLSIEIRTSLFNAEGPAVGGLCLVNLVSGCC